MTRIVLAAALALAAALFAGAALADVKEDYMAACMVAYGDNEEFCTCKTEQAVILVDDEMLGYIIAFYQSPTQFRTDIAEGKVPAHIQEGWPYFVKDSNKVCLPAS